MVVFQEEISKRRSFRHGVDVGEEQSLSDIELLVGPEWGLEEATACIADTHEERGRRRFDERRSQLLAVAPPPSRADRRVRPIDEIAKRAIDLIGSVLLLLGLAPLMLFIAALVRCSSRGPVLFRQQRVGQGGRLFWIIKFRTMRVASGGPSITAGGDDRVTPIGRWLRHWKLDELPQFINVLRGDMSLVGPRPQVPEFVSHFSAGGREILAIRPGVTGISQLEFRHEEALLAGRDDVERFYLDTILPAKLRLELHYVRERTLVGDFRLLLRTVAAVIHKGHASGPSARPSTLAVGRRCGLLGRLALCRIQRRAECQPGVKRSVS
jgi:lipopolysaccharide/colanic/teichoic acid biosynthesis glycosyltransferase